MNSKYNANISVDHTKVDRKGNLYRAPTNFHLFRGELLAVDRISDSVTVLHQGWVLILQDILGTTTR